MKKNLFYILLAVFMFSCTKENNDLSNLSDILYISRNNADMPAYIHGNAASKVFIVVLHGGPGGSGLEYRGDVFINQLEKKYAVVYFDQRGQGMSQGHLKNDQITIDEILLDIELLTQVIKQKYGSDNSLFLMGHSWGGTLGSAYFTAGNDFQKDYKGWIEVDGAHDFDYLLKTQITMFNQIGTEQIAANNDVDFWTKSINKVNSVDTLNYTTKDLGELNDLGGSTESILRNSGVIADPPVEGSIEPILGAYFKNNPLTAAISGGITGNILIKKHNLIEFSASPYFDQITIPTLLLWGKYDFVVPPALAQQAFDLIINSTDKEMVIFENSGHSPMSDEPEKFAAEVIDFIDRNK